MGWSMVRVDAVSERVRIGAVCRYPSNVPLLQLSEVCLAYGHVPLLDHADLVVEPGEHIGLIGRNGTGKTSLLKIIAGAARPDDGKVTLASGMKVASVAQEPVFEG